MAPQLEDAFQVVVVGGGPAGLSAARVAAARGARTLLLERNNEIGVPVRTSGASWVEDLRRLEVPDRFWHPTRMVRLSSPGRTVRFDYDPPINCVLDVRALWQHLAVEAARAGAVVRVRSRVTGLADGALEVSGLEGVQQFQPPVVVDASGGAAVVARARGLLAGPRRVGVGAELELYAPGWDPEELWLAVGTGIAPSGYAWVFPAPGGRVRAGVGLLAPDSGLDPASYLRRFVRGVPALARGAELEYHRGVIPSDGPIGASVADGLLVAGDAAGHVLATAGEGIRFALELGALAGETAAAAAIAGDCSARALSGYEQSWSDRYRGLFAMTDRLNRKLAGMDDKGWDNALSWLETAGPAAAARLMRGDIFQGAVARHMAETLLPVLAWLL
ncbi:MAG: NAD(P)/FAD-dependent oxidoreductase [Candidatus Wallbacteria bacterium]|nr:NAD(P)/FAD-dependent oxidoreductase [Candidatus Wallbacteria bacterium]